MNTLNKNPDDIMWFALVFPHIIWLNQLNGAIGKIKPIIFTTTSENSAVHYRLVPEHFPEKLDTWNCWVYIQIVKFVYIANLTNMKKHLFIWQSFDQAQISIPQE